MSRDFLTNRTRTKAIIGSGNGAGNQPTPKLIIYGDTSATDNIGGRNFNSVLDDTSFVGNDVFMYVSGVIDGKENSTNNSVSVFGGDLVVSGTLYAKKQIIEIEGVATGSLTIDGGINSSGTITANDLILTNGNINVQNGSVNIGPPEDSSYTDGLFTDFTPNTLIGTAVDRFNEVLKALAPTPAPSLDQFDVDTPDGISAKLSFGSLNDQSSASPAYISVNDLDGAGGYDAIDVNTVYGLESATGGNYRLGIFNGTQIISGTLNEDVPHDTYTNGIVNYPNNSFGSADQGILKLFLNGSEIHSVNLSLTNSTCGYHNTTSITIDSTTSLKVGMEVFGDNIPAGATISSISNSTTFIISSSATSSDAVTNQTLTFILGSGNDLNSNSSGFKNLTAATPGKFASDTDFKTFKYRTGEWQVGTADQVNGRNYAQVKHVIGASETVTGFAEWVNDDNNDALTVSSNNTVFTGTGSKYRSGVQYYTGGNISYVANVSNVYKYIYSTNPVTFSITSSPSNILSLNNQNIPDINTGSSENHTKVLSLDTGNVSLVLPGSRKILDGTVTVGCNVPHPLKPNLQSSATQSTQNNILIDNVTTTSDNTTEYFNDENFRLKSGSFGSQSNVSGGSFNWDSTQTIFATNSGYNDALMIYDGKLVSTEYSDLFKFGNFSLANGLSSNPDYSAVGSGSNQIQAANKYYYRKIQNDTNQAIRDLSYTISGDGALVDHADSLSSSEMKNFKIYFKKPGSTAWLDAATDYDFHDISTDGDGCNAVSSNIDTSITSSPSTNIITFGTENVANSEFIVMKIETDSDWNGHLEDISFSLGLTNSNPVNVNAITNNTPLDKTNFDDTTYSATPPTITSGKLSFGTSNNVSGYTNVGSAANGTENVNAVYQQETSSSGHERLGIIDTTSSLFSNMKGRLNLDVSSNGQNYPANAWGKGYANKGTLQAYLNGSTLGNALDLTNTDAQNNTYLYLSEALPSKNSNGVPNHNYYYRTGTWNIVASNNPGLQRKGWNYFKVVHSYTDVNSQSQTDETNFVEWVYSNEQSSEISFSNETVSTTFTQGASAPNYLSGIQYFTSARGTFSLTAANVYKYVYSDLSNAITYPLTTNANITAINVTGAGVVNGSVSGIERGLPNLDTSVTNCADQDIQVEATFDFSGITSSIPGSLQNASFRCKIDHPISSNTYETPSSSPINSLSPLMYTVQAGSNYSTTLEDFTIETNRLKAGTYASQSDVTSSSNDWDSTQSLTGSGSGGNAGHNDGLQFFNGKLIAPKTDFRNHNPSSSINTNLIGPQNNPDYSTAASSSGTPTTRTFYRYFQNTENSSIATFDIKIKGSGTNIVSSTTGSLSSSNIFVFVKLPNTSNSQTTGFLDLAEAYDSEEDITQDGSGCLQGSLASSLTSNGVTNRVTFGVVFVPGASFNNGDDKNIVVKIQASKDWTGNLDEIEIIWNI